ncbi:MAG: protein kinase, partial [Blastocatellia bacterium]|nr:protein kinase [Blastocatellia bacterium]
IALKTLPTDVSFDVERMRRFVHEAKSASGLNHPNIITIYEVNDEGEQPFIAMEYVKGDSLARLIRRRSLPLQRFLDIAVQVASALAAAHEANVVHRDIKPDNIIVRPDGLVKVVDFGLAKLTENDGSSDPEAETIAHRTNPGMILGTASYMSPEQARGKDIDGRSDIFSFGTVLYQMLTGTLPFNGENYVDVIASILHKEPPPISEHAPDVPHDVETLVRKCLRKNRDERFQKVRELLADLRDIQKELDLEIRSGQRSGEHSTPDAMRTTDGRMIEGMTTARHTRFRTSSISELIRDEVTFHPVRLVVILLVLVGAAAVGGLEWSRLSSPNNVAEAFQRMRFSKITTSGNVVSDAVALSPDGKYLVYVVEEAGKQSLWVKQSEIQSNVQTLEPSEADYKSVAFSPDSNNIYYVTQQVGEPAALFQIPVLGGAPRRLVNDIGSGVAFSPDGRRMTYAKVESVLAIANADGTNERELARSENGEKWLLTTWAPDGERMMAAVYSPHDSMCHLVTINVADGRQERFAGPSWLRIAGLQWLRDNDGILLTGRDPETQLSQIWHIAYPSGTPTRVTNDPNSYQGLSVATNAGSIAAVQQNRNVNIWRYIGSAKEPVQATADLGRDEGMSGVAWVPDGRMVYTVRTRGLQDLWIVGAGGSDGRQLTFNAGANFSPTVTPDGRHIIFVSTRGGAPSIWRIDINGENPVELAQHSGVSGEPDISPDGRWVVYNVGDLNDQTTIWKVSIDGGEPTQLTTTESGRPRISPDGRTIACHWGFAKTDSRTTLALIPFEGGEVIQKLDLPRVLRSRTYRWTADGKAFLYVDGKEKIENLWRQPLDLSPAKQLTRFTSDRIYRFDVSGVGDELVMSRGKETSDVVMISDFR